MASTKARRALKRFPGIADPGADKLLLFAGVTPYLALDSNGLRVLLRLGYGEEDDAPTRETRVPFLAAENLVHVDLLCCPTIAQNAADGVGSFAYLIGLIPTQ